MRGEVDGGAGHHLRRPGRARDGGLPLDADWKLPGPWNRLDHDVALLDAAREQLRLGALQEGVDDLGVPAGVDDADAQAGAVVLFWGWALHGDTDS